MTIVESLRQQTLSRREGEWEEFYHNHPELADIPYAQRELMKQCYAAGFMKSAYIAVEIIQEGKRNDRSLVEEWVEGFTVGNRMYAVDITREEALYAHQTEKNIQSQGGQK